MLAQTNISSEGSVITCCKVKCIFNGFSLRAVVGTGRTLGYAQTILNEEVTEPVAMDRPLLAQPEAEICASLGDERVKGDAVFTSRVQPGILPEQEEPEI